MRNSVSLKLNKQRGFVLIACLVILLVLTVLGINTMSTANLEERMASNSQSMLAMFQHAETALSIAINDTPTLNTVAQTEVATQLTYTLGGQAVTADIAIPTGGTGTVNTEGNSFGIIIGIPLELTAKAESAGTGARSKLVQGVARKAPNPGAS